MKRESDLDPQDADRILDGDTVAEGDLGPLADLLAEARATFAVAPAPAMERRHLAAMVEAFKEAPQAHALGRKSMLSRVFAVRAIRASAVALAALLATGSALAGTGNLPSKAQDAVANTVDNVGVNIPGGDDEINAADEQEEADEQDEANENGRGPAEKAEEHGVARSTTDCPATDFEGNHGEYVSGTEETPRSDAAHSDCGKPAPAVENSQAGTHGPNEKAGEPDEQGRSGEHRQNGEHGQGSAGEGRSSR